MTTRNRRDPTTALRPADRPGGPAYIGALLLLTLAGCGGGEKAAGPPAKIALTTAQVEAIKKQDESIEDQEGGAFKKRVEAQSKRKTRP